MAVEIFSTSTEYIANEITISRGTVADITAVGVYHSEDPNSRPDVTDFTTVQLVDARFLIRCLWLRLERLTCCRWSVPEMGTLF
mgnify:CR=1 FL=1